jgi:heme exporter protein D
MMWRDEGVWIALGVTLITLVAAFVMHRIFVKILKQPAPDQREELSKNE